MEYGSKGIDICREIDSIIEELEILLDKDMMDSIKRGDEEIKRGEVYTLEEFHNAVKE